MPAAAPGKRRTRASLIQHTSYRTLLLLACCQALVIANASGLVSMVALVGYAMVETKSLATLAATTYVIGSAVTTMPASLWMSRVGRRRGFMTAALVNVVGCLVAAFGLWTSSYALFCIGTAIIGVYAAFGLHYRFAAAEVAAPADRAKAISLVLTGGIVGAFLGPASSASAKDWLPTPFLGSLFVLAGFAVIALAFQSRLDMPPPTRAERRDGGRSLGTIVRQPVFVVAALAGALGYGLMNLLMVATPLAMSFCQHPFSAAATVFQWHIVAMYGPGFVTGHLIRRFGVLAIIASGALLIAGCVAVAVNGDTIAHFLVALGLLGVGWNFMYTGGTTLLTEAYSPEEKAKAQGANDFCIFAMMAVSSLSSGGLVSAAGWERMNLGALPFVALMLAAVAWLAWLRRAPRPARA
jgi:MFS family permease